MLCRVVAVSRVRATSAVNPRRWMTTNTDAPNTATSSETPGRLKAKRQTKPKTEAAERKPRVYKTDNPEVASEFFTQLGKELMIEPGNYQKWYSLRVSDVLKRPSGGILLRRNFGGSISEALKKTFPEHTWEEFRFENPPSKRYFYKPENQRAYFDWLAQKLDIKSPLNWYQVNWEQVNARSDIGCGFRQIVGTIHLGNVGKALSKIYPEANLVAARFPRLSNLVDVNVAVNVAEVKSYIEHLASELRMTKLSDWYCVTLKQLRGVRDYKEIPARLGGLPAMLVRIYPEHPWDMTKFSFGTHRNRFMGTLKPSMRPKPAAAKSSSQKPTSRKYDEKSAAEEEHRESISVRDADS